METYFRNVFICYSRIDEIQAKNVHVRLKAEKFDVFLDQVNILPGMAWEKKTLTALQSANFVVIILTEGSAERNGYAMKEIRRILELYQTDLYARRKIFPVRVVKADLPEGLGEFQWTTYSAEGLDRMVASMHEQRQRWIDEISMQDLMTVPKFNLRESWPWFSLMIILAMFVAVSALMQS